MLDLSKYHRKGTKTMTASAFSLHRCLAAKVSKAFFLPALCLLMLSCENDLKTVSEMMAADTIPLETATDVEIIYSDSAETRIVLKSPRLLRYGGKEPYIDFPRGVHVIFYDKGLVEKSVLHCQKAVIFEKTRIMEARNKVEVIGIQRKETLHTEHLVWDERKARIFSDEHVRITTRDKVLYGQGFESDQSFDNWVIKRPTGSFSIDEQRQ